MTDGPDWAKPDPQPEQPPEQRQLPSYPTPAPPSGGWTESAAKPGVIPLRPLGLSEILDGAISSMRAHPKVMLGVSAIVVTISQLIILAATYPLLDDVNRAAKLDANSTSDEALSAFGASLAVVGLALLITLLSRVILSGFLTVAVGKAVLGQPVGFGEVWSRVRPRLGALLGLTLILPAIALAAAFLLVLIVYAAGPISILVILIAVPFAIYFYILFSLATPALMLENASITKAFGRSRALVRGSWWRTFGIQLLAGIIAGIAAAIITIPFELISGGFDNTTDITMTYLALSTIGAIIAGTITEPFAAGVIVLLYTDQRMRREGMDIELARAAGLTPPPPQYPA